MNTEQIQKLRKTQRLSCHDGYIRKEALRHARFFFTSSLLKNYPKMQKMHIEKHNKLYRKILNDPIYDARCFLDIRERN